MTPEDQRLQRTVEALKPLFTWRVFIVAGLALSALILTFGLAPNFIRALNDEAKLSELVRQVPFVALLALGGGFGAIITALMVAWIGGSMILWLNRRKP